MSAPPPIETARLLIVPETLAATRARIAAMEPAEKAHVSADWLARLAALTADDVWVLGFSLVRREGRVALGQAGFKGPPSAEGAVEIAYGIDPNFEGQGYATETAEALTAFAFASGRVRCVRAHTLPETNASGRVLTKCGFRCVGEVMDPEDGLVWRWEKEKT